MSIKCNKCGKECRIGTEEVGVDSRKLPIIHRFSYCDSCMTKNDLDLNLKKKESGFGIAGLICSVLTASGIFAIVSLVLCLIGLTRKDKKSVCGIIGLCLCFTILFVNVDWFSDTAETNTYASEEVEKAEISKEVEQLEVESLEEKKEDDSEKIAKPSNAFVVGDVVETSSFKISFLSVSEYVSDNPYIQPKDGNMYYRMEFEFENISDSDAAISSMMNWDCYADDYAVDQSWISDDQIDASLSPGKKVKGSVYFEVPIDANSIVLEYETNFWTENKVIFIVK